MLCQVSKRQVKEITPSLSLSLSCFFLASLHTRISPQQFIFTDYLYFLPYRLQVASYLILSCISLQVQSLFEDLMSFLPYFLQLLASFLLIHSFSHISSFSFSFNSLFLKILCLLRLILCSSLLHFYLIILSLIFPASVSF